MLRNIMPASNYNVQAHCETQGRGLRSHGQSSIQHFLPEHAAFKLPWKHFSWCPDTSMEEGEGPWSCSKVHTCSQVFELRELAEGVPKLAENQNYSTHYTWGDASVSPFSEKPHFLLFTGPAAFCSQAKSNSKDKQPYEGWGEASLPPTNVERRAALNRQVHEVLVIRMFLTLLVKEVRGISGQSAPGKYDQGALPVFQPFLIHDPPGMR